MSRYYWQISESGGAMVVTMTVTIMIVTIVEMTTTVIMMVVVVDIWDDIGNNSGNGNINHVKSSDNGMRMDLLIGFV